MKISEVVSRLCDTYFRTRIGAVVAPTGSPSEEHGPSAAAPAEAPAALDAALLGACLAQASAAEGRGTKRPASEAFQADAFQAEAAAADPVDLMRLVLEEQQ